MLQFTHEGVLKAGTSTHYILDLDKHFEPGDTVPLTALGASRFADKFTDIRQISAATLQTVGQLAIQVAEVKALEAQAAASLLASPVVDQTAANNAIMAAAAAEQAQQYAAEASEAGGLSLGTEDEPTEDDKPTGSKKTTGKKTINKK